MKKYTGFFFGVRFIDHLYEPEKKGTEALAKRFPFEYSVGDFVKFRKPHRKTMKGRIESFAYSTEKNGGATIKVYKIGNNWIDESYIKKISSSIF